MVVDDLDIASVSVRPPEAYSPPIVDADTELAFSVSRKLFESVARRYAEIIEGLCGVQHVQLYQRSPLDVRREFPGPFPLKHRLCVAVPKAPDHNRDNNASR